MGENMEGEREKGNGGWEGDEWMGQKGECLTTIRSTIEQTINNESMCLYSKISIKESIKTSL